MGHLPVDTYTEQPAVDSFDKTYSAQATHSTANPRSRASTKSEGGLNNGFPSTVYYYTGISMVNRPVKRGCV